MITKEAIINITQEDIDSPEDIEINLHVNGPDGPEDGVTYTINYPKDHKDENI